MEDSETRELLTKQQAIAYLGLDKIGVKKPEDSLSYLRQTNQIEYVIVCSEALYPLQSLREYLDKNTVGAVS